MGKVIKKSSACADGIKTRRNWNTGETTLVLNYLLDVIRSGKTIEKPTANAFYSTLLTKVQLEDCSTSQVRNQVTNMKRKYMAAVQWRSQTGQGVEVEHGEEYMKGVLLKRCPQFEQLEEIYGEKLSIHPPFVIDSSVPSDSEKDGNASDEIANNTEAEVSFTDAQVEDEDRNESQTVGDTSKNRQNRKKRARSPSTSSGSKALSSLCKARFDIHHEELKFSKEKWEYEKLISERNEDLEKEKFLFAKEMETKQFELEKQKAADHVELEKYRISEEMKLKLEIAKLQFKPSV